MLRAAMRVTGSMLAPRVARGVVGLGARTVAVGKGPWLRRSIFNLGRGAIEVEGNWLMRMQPMSSVPKSITTVRERALERAVSERHFEENKIGDKGAREAALRLIKKGCGWHLETEEWRRTMDALKEGIENNWKAGKDLAQLQILLWILARDGHPDVAMKFGCDLLMLAVTEGFADMAQDQACEMVRFLEEIKLFFGTRSYEWQPEVEDRLARVTKAVYESN